MIWLSKGFKNMKDIGYNIKHGLTMVLQILALKYTESESAPTTPEKGICL